MDFYKILQDLKNRVFYPIYLLQGEEPFFIDEISNYIEKNVLTEEEKSFNQTIIYGPDSEGRAIAEASLRYPMMAERQVIIVKEAQNLSKIDDLAMYAERPMSSTILVLNYKYKNLDGRTKLFKAISSKGVVLTTKKLYDNQLPAWIDSYLKQYNYSITPQASQIVAESLGTDLTKVANELNKLIIAVTNTNKITPEHIEENIGFSKDFNLFELQDALGSRNIYKANRIINYFASNPQQHPIQMTTAVLFGYFSKILSYHFLKDKSEHSAVKELGGRPFYIRKIISASRNYNKAKLFDIINLLRDFDMKSKGIGAPSMVDQGELQKELIYKILH